MSLPSKEETCKHALDVLADVLENADLCAVAQGMPRDKRVSAASTLSQLEEALVTQSRLVREQAAMLMGQLKTGCFVDHCTCAQPHILDFPLFVRKSRLLHERMRRVGVTFKSVKHVGLLHEGSTGRRVIMDRALMSLNELLETIVAVAATVTAVPLLLNCRYQDASPEHVAITSQKFPGCLPFLSTESCHSVKNTCDVEKQNGGGRSRSATSQRRPLKELPTTARPPFTQKKEKKEEREEKEDAEEVQAIGAEKARSGSNSPGKATGAADGRQETLSPTRTREGTTLSSLSGSPETRRSTERSSLSLQHSDSNAWSTGRETSASRGDPADSLATMAAAHDIPLKELCALNRHLLAFKYKALPHNTPVRIPCRKENGNVPVSTQVSVQRRLFQGQLWKELLSEENAAASKWKEMFTAEIGLLFGIPNEWVSEVQVADDSVKTLNGGDQEVVFKVRLPLSLGKGEVRKRIQQHEFTNLLLLYEELQESREQKGGQGEEHILKKRDFCLPQKSSDAELLTVLSAGQEHFLDGPSESNEDSNNNNDSRKIVMIHSDKSLSCMNDGFFKVIDEEAEAREMLHVLEKSSWHIILRVASGPRQAMGWTPQERVASSTECVSLQKTCNQNYNHQRVGQSGEIYEVSDAIKSPVIVDSHDASSLLPRNHSMSPSQNVLVASPEDKERGRLLPSSSSTLPEGSKENIDIATRSDEKSADASSHVPRFFVEKSMGGPQKTKEPTVQLISTAHKKVLLGEGWNDVFVKKEEEFRRTFTTEVAALFELPEEQVRDLKFAPGDPEVTFQLVHDRYLQEREINALLAVFDFPQVRDLCKNCIGSCAVDASGGGGGGDHTIDGENDGKCVHVPDVQPYLFFRDDETNIRPSCTEREGENMSRIIVKEDEEFYGQQQQRCSRSLSATLVRDDTATPDNEPVTLAHLALVHDLSIDALVKANPHLATFGVYDVLPPTARVTIPRSLDDDLCFFIEDADGQNSGFATPSVLNSSPSRLHTPHEGDAIRSNSLMNVKNLARRLGVSVNALRQRNSHLHVYSDADPLPKNCSISVPAQLLATSDSLGVVSPARSGSHSPAKSLKQRDPLFTNVVRTPWGSDKKTLLTPPRALLSESHAFRDFSANENDSAAASSDPRPMKVPQQPLGLMPANQEYTPQSFAQRLSHASPGRDVAHRRAPRSCSAVRNALVRRDHAVLLMVRSIEQFLLLRFFSKWQYIARMRKEMTTDVRGDLTGSSVKFASARREALRDCSLTAVSRRGRSQTHLTSPRTGRTSRGRRTGLIDKTMGDIAQSQSRSLSRQSEPKARLSRTMLSARLERQSQEKNVRSRTASRHAHPRRPDSERILCSSSKLSQIECRLFSQPSSSRSGTPCLNFSRASSTLSNTLSHEQRSRTGKEVLPPDHLLLGLRVAPSLTITEAYGEAARAGLRRGDQLREVEGGRVTTLRGLRKALNCVVGPQVHLTVQEKNGGALKTFCVLRSRDTNEKERSASTSSSLTEPKITPLLTAAKKAVLHLATYGRDPVAPQTQPRLQSASATRLRAPRGRYRTQTQPQA